MLRTSQCRDRCAAALTLALTLAASLAFGSAQAKFAVLYKFSGPDGFYPSARLALDQAGNLYGTTVQGGDNLKSCFDGCGIVFKLAPDGTETLLHSFQAGSDGAWPYAGVILDTAGNIYGTTDLGGRGTVCYAGNGCGTVFRIAPDGTETVLYAFTGGSDGSNPVSDLTIDAAGNLYGTTVNGGSNNVCNFNIGCGAVFKLAPDGTETVLYAFKGGNDGLNPQGGVIADKSGNLYGTTVDGGANNSGVVYKISPAGKETVLYSFKAGTDGNWPYGDLISDKSGNLYGTTLYGGANYVGTVFEVSPDGTETLLHSFNADNGDGYNPSAGLVRDRAGNFYGTTISGGNNKCGGGGCGTVFKLAPDGTETVLHVLTFGEGKYPAASLILDRDRDGYLYGTAPAGGNKTCWNNSCGTLFRLTP